MDSGDALQDFSYIGAAVRGRTFPGFPGKSESRNRRLVRREPIRLNLMPGDLVSISGLLRGDSIACLVVGTDGSVSPRGPGPSLITRKFACRALGR